MFPLLDNATNNAFCGRVPSQFFRSREGVEDVSTNGFDCKAKLPGISGCVFAPAQTRQSFLNEAVKEINAVQG